MKLIEPFDENSRPRIQKLNLRHDQSEFVAAIPEILESVSDRITGHIINHGEQAAGFFVLDTEYSSEYAFAPPRSVGLRSFFISSEFQGLGLAKKALAALPSYVGSVKAGVEFIYLTVNCRNTAAANLYRRYGFEDRDELYLGGPKGPQHIMRMPVT